MGLFHAVVWLDHSQAHVIHFNRDTDQRQLVNSSRGVTHQHHHTGAIGPGRALPDTAFFDAIARALGDAEEILVAGPASAKQEFLAHVERQHRDMHRRIVAVEPLDHPTDNQLLAHARRYFERVDRMRGVPTNMT